MKVNESKNIFKNRNKSKIANRVAMFSSIPNGIVMILLFITVVVFIGEGVFLTAESTLMVNCKSMRNRLDALKVETDFFSFQGISGIKVIYLNSDIQVMKEPSYANSEITPEAIKLTGDYSTVIENAIANWGTYNKAEDENGVKWYVRSGCEIPTTDYTYTDN